jgi:hypothetical protein
MATPADPAAALGMSLDDLIAKSKVSARAE